MGSLLNLKVLKLDDNYLGGYVPEEIGNLTKLQQLNFRSNNFFGGIPSSVLYLKEMEILDPRENYLSMEISNDIGDLTKFPTLAFYFILLISWTYF
ncbi:hypothetical protein NC652_009945 [Populus alba x Populus x berolinensis]|nr:hypothetical protein NC652_009945 [Populus alba x Populus x berolinensis]